MEQIAKKTTLVFDLVIAVQSKSRIQRIQNITVNIYIHIYINVTLPTYTVCYSHMRFMYFHHTIILL